MTLEEILQAENPHCELLKQVTRELDSIKDIEELKQIRAKYLGKNGMLKQIEKELWAK